MIELQSDPSVHTVSGPMCRWEMVSEDAKGHGYVRKETQFVTNSRTLAELELAKVDVDTFISSTEGPSLPRSTLRN